MSVKQESPVTIFDLTGECQKVPPNNYMALYHAGMSAYILNDFSLSKQYLQSFIEIYDDDDGW